MNETSINAIVTGGAVGVAGAQNLHIENLYVGAAASTEPAKPAGPIPPCPYPGLAYFGPQDAARFFGRDEAIEDLVAAVRKRSFTALVGASGSGKSSVVLSGLAPKLSALGGWRSTYFRIGTEPDKNPFAALARALSPMLGDGDVVDQMTRAQKLANSLADGDISLVYVIGQCRAANPSKRILLIADQFEEVFTLVPDDALRERFINTLIDTFPDTAQGILPDVSFVLTLRADFVNQAVSYRALADKLNDCVEFLGSMTRSELREAVVKPAEAIRVEFERGLVETILDDVEKRPGSLPLLQFTLREMWGRLTTRLLTRADYDAIGGVTGALAKRAQEIFDASTKIEEDKKDEAAIALFRQLFTRLVTVGVGVEPTRRVVERDELSTEAWALAQKLADERNRLVVISSATSRQETVEVVHEALIHVWPTLVDWVNKDPAFISWRNQLKPRLDDWRAHPLDDGTLLRGGPLAAAELWVGQRSDDLSSDEKAFVDASRGLRDAEKQRARARILELQHQRANLLAALGNTELVRSNLDAALRFAIQGAREDLALGLELIGESTAMETLATLVWQLQWRLGFRAGDESVNAASFSPNGTRIVTASSDKTARVWDAVTGEEIAVLRGHEREVVSAEFSPVGTRIVTASSDKTARMWDVASAKEIAILRGHEDGVWSAAFSPDGTRIVTASSDKTSRLWDVASAKEIAILRGHEDGVWSAAFSPDGTRIVTASWDRTARVWEAATAKEVAVLCGHKGWVRCAAFSPDGTRIVTASEDRTGRVWDAATANEVAVLRGHEERVLFASFNLNGTLIVTASLDKTARLWDAATAKDVAILRGHENMVFSASFSLDGTRIITASSDKTARVWDPATAKAKEMAVLRGHKHTVRSAAFSPDGMHIVTASWDVTARLWDVATTKEIAVLRGHKQLMTSAAFSSDGTRIVTVSEDKTARVWDAATTKEIAILRHEWAVNSAAFSPDGTRIVTASWDVTARLWDVATGKEIAVLRGHEDGVLFASFNRDGTRLITASLDKTARLWDAATGKEIATLRGHEDRVLFAMFSLDGTRVVTASLDKTARVWDAATAREIAVLSGHEQPVTSAAFSPEGTRVVTASLDKTARVWNAATAKELGVLRGHENAVNSAAFSPDGTRIVTASDDMTARIWDAQWATMGPKELLTEVCQHRMIGFSTMTRGEMRLAGYPDSEPLIDVCAGVAAGAGQ